MYERELEELIQKLHIFNNVYDKVRIVDPVKKKVLHLYGDLDQDTPEHCFFFWRSGEICENCVSMKAFRERDTFMKIEYTDREIYLVTAIPIELAEQVVVLELMKNATNNISFSINGESASVDFDIMLDSLNNRAIKDSLTGIYNRRYINEKLPLDMINANLSNHSISVIMVDIDMFKNVNDTYGHLIGDCTIKSVANLLQRSLKRENDWVARYGGEEFLICLPGTNLSFAKDLAENIRNKIERTPIECGELEFSITASFGISVMTPKFGTSVNELIEEADRKLYEAKRNGRNRVES